MSYIFVIHRSQSLCLLSTVCPVCAWFLSTPRLPVASYKNSFSMTEWRIRLEGSGQSSGTPFKDVCSALFHFCRFICALCGNKQTNKKKGRSALGCVSSAAKLLLNLFRNCQEFSCCVKKLILYLHVLASHYCLSNDI